MTRILQRRGLAAGFVVLLCTAGAFAAPGFWQVVTQADFLRGQVEQLSIDEHGRLTLGPELTRLYDGSVSVVWTLLAQPDGSVLLGTGNDGKVFKVSPEGEGRVFFDSQELEVHALAPAPDGGLYAATSPDGRIYRVSASGEATPFFDPEDKYIWSLAVDDKGVLFAGTGDTGTVYRITPDGKGDTFFESKASHVVALRFDPTGTLLVGTGSPGRLFRVDRDGTGFLVLDTPYQEVRGLTLGPGNTIYVAALSSRSNGGGETPEAPPTPTPPPTPSVSTEIMSFAIIDSPVATQGSSAGGGPRESRGASGGAVYRIQADGLWDLIWDAGGDSPYDVSVEPGGALLVATGTKGKVFRLSGDPVQAVLVTRVPAQHATTLWRAGARTLLATANPGLLVAMSNGRATRGTYESEVKDAGMVASWGTLSWRATAPAGTSVELSTRSGNTATPDEAWSAWSAAYAAPDGSPITSPKARYLQWRAVLSGLDKATPVLTSVSAAYLQRNIRPRVESITVHPAGVVFQKPFSTGETEIAGFDEEPQERRLANQGAGGAQSGAPALGRRIYQRGLQTFAWKADDDNGDELAYDVLYRREGETEWRTLKTDLAETLTVWDTSSAPNGTYVLKVVASDGKSNPADLSLRGELESQSFEIDNTPPTVSIGTVTRDGSRFLVPFEVRDLDSVLQRVEYSLDAQRWQTAFPRDGILDSRRESFEIRLDAGAAGQTLVIRATDGLNNVSAGQVQVK